MRLVVLSFLSALLFVIFFSCNNQQKLTKTENLEVTSDENVLKEIVSSKNKAVYLSFDSLDNDFGSIILLDLSSKKSMKLFDNRFFNSSPTLVGNGEKVLFESAQLGDPQHLKITKYHAGRQLYLIDFNDLSIKRYFSDNRESKEMQFFYFTGLTWDEKREQIYFSNKDNDFYKLSDGEALPTILHTFEKDIKIWDIVLSPNKKYLALWYDDFKNQYSGIYIYDIDSTKFINDIRGNRSSISLLGWSFDNNIYYRSDSLYLFDFGSNSVKTTELNINLDSLMVRKVYAQDSQSILLLVDKLKYLPEVKYSVRVSTEIARYNFITQKLDWLTNDGSKKEKLSVFIKED
jgi:hypothetical protein